MIRFVVGLLVVLPSVALAVPSVLSHQGRVLSADGLPLNGALTMTVSLYDEVDSSAAFWTKTYGSVPVEDGYYALRLVTDDASSPLSVASISDGETWIQVTVAGQSMGSRVQLHSTPYAMMAGGVQLPPAQAGECDTPGVLAYDETAGEMLLCHSGSYQVVATVEDTPTGGGPIVGVRNPGRAAEWALLQVSESTSIPNMAAWRDVCVAAGLGVPASIENNVNCLGNVGEPRYLVTTDCNMLDQRGDTWREDTALFQSSFPGGSLHFLRYANGGSAYWTHMQCNPAQPGDGSESTCPTTIGSSTTSFTLNAGDWLTCARPI